MILSPLALSVKCKQCQQPVTVHNVVAMAAALRSGIMCQECRNGVQRKWSKETYQEYLNTEHWHVTRKKALKRAGYKCQLCAATDTLHVHHNDYSRLGGEKMTDLVVLCGECHKRHHGIDY